MGCRTRASRPERHSRRRGNAINGVDRHYNISDELPSTKRIAFSAGKPAALLAAASTMRVRPCLCSGRATECGHGSSHGGRARRYEESQASERVPDSISSTREENTAFHLLRIAVFAIVADRAFATWPRATWRHCG